MAAEVLSGISSALSTTFSAELKRQWNRSAILAKMLRMVPATGAGGGKQIGWDVMFSGAGAASFAEGSDVGAGELLTDPPVPATLAFGQYRSAFQVSNLEINAAMASPAQATALGQIVLERVYDSLAKIASVANTDLFTGTGSDGSANPNIIGLGTALVSAGSYAGINTATYSEWKSNLLANGGVTRPLTLDLLANLEQLIFAASGKEPDVLVCSPGVYRKYEGLFSSAVRVQQDGRGPMGGFYGSVPAGSLFWRGKPVIRDRNAAAGTVYMLNTDEAQIRPLPFGGPAADGVDARPASIPSSNGETTEATGLSCMVYPLGRTGSAVKFVAETYLQLQVTRPNSHGILSDISEV